MNNRSHSVDSIRAQKLGSVLRLGISTLACLCAIAPITAETLQSALRSMLDSYPSLQATRSGAEASRESWNATRRQRLPQIALTAQGGGERYEGSNGRHLYGDTAEASITATQLIYDGGRLRGLSEEAELDYLQQEAIRMEREQTFALELSIAYVDIILYRTLVDYAKNNVSIHEEALSKTKEKFDSGAGPKADVELVQARLSRAQSTLYDREQQLRQVVNAYQKLTGSLPGNLQEPSFPDGSLPADYDAANFSGNPTIVAAQNSLDSELARHRIARSAYVPELNLELQGTAEDSDRSGKSEEGSALLTFTYDLFDGGQRKASLNRSRALVDQARWELDNARIEVAERFRNAWSELEGANGRVASMSNYQASMEAVVSAYQKQFELGQRALINVLDVRNELFSAASSYEEERIARLRAAYRILASTGEILNALL